jgi:very-short-patch-repair endonuclease
MSPAAALVRVPRAVLSHHTAARAWGMELVDDDDSQHLSVPRNNGRYALPGWHVHRSDMPAADIVERQGIRLTSVPRSVRDLALALPLDRAVAVADSAIRQRLVTLPAVQAGLVGRGPGAGTLRRVAGLVDPLSGSVLESLLRVLLVTAGLGGFLTQYVVRDGRRVVARVDFCWPECRLIVEADGFAFHSDRAAYRKDRERMNELERLGWRVLRFTWEDVMHRPGAVVALVAECLAPSAAA